MISQAPLEQRNVYKGTPARAWLRLQLIGSDGQIRELELLVDTGNLCAIIIDAETMQAMRWRESSSTQSNFGSLDGGWLRAAIPELDFDVKLLGYANDSVVSVVKRSDADFAGLVGLPLLRMLDYGGNSGCFWVGPPFDE
jgi:predicted aspartyl protease